MLTEESAAGAGPTEARRRWLHALLAPIGPLPGTVVVAGVAFGLALRVAILHSTVGALDSDEAIVGLMARQFASGHYNAFYWGQAYGGTIEVALAAIGFKLFGASAVVLKTVPMLLSAVAAILVWRVGRRVTGPGPAALAGLLVWIWPANYLWWSIKARGFYEATLCLGLAVLLISLRIGQHARRLPWLDWVGLGLVAGLGWWQSPQIAYFLLPAAVWLLWTVRAAAWRAIVAIPPAAIGAAPWLVANLASNFASLSPPPSPVKGGYLDHLSVLVREGLPMTFGLKVIYTSRWVPPVDAMAAAYVVIVAVVVAGCAKRWPGGWLVVAMLAAFPFLHALLSLASTVAEGRYTLFVLPALALALAHRADRRLSAVVLTGSCVAITVAGALALHGNTSPYFSGRRVPASFTSLERALEAHGTTAVWSNYWVAYRLTFETDGRVLAAPVTNGRDPALTSLVRAAIPAAGHVFLTGTREDMAFRRGLIARHIHFASYTVADEWTVYLPTTPVGPTAIARAEP